MKTLILLLLNISVLLSQFTFYTAPTFKEPLVMTTTEKINSELINGTTVKVFKLQVIGKDFINIFGLTQDGVSIMLDMKFIGKFSFNEINNIDKAWNKNQLVSGTFTNLIKKGLQYDLRNDIHDESLNYLNTLNNNNRFFEDSYIEDYLYTLLNKIHPGTLQDRRPGNIYIKILKDTDPQAYVLPNGCIIVTTGLLSTIQSEDELVGVLAHEVAHFVLDHAVLNYNHEIDLKEKADFWASFATIAAASADVYLTMNNKNHVPGILTTSTAIIASVISNEALKRLGIKYSQEQELMADATAIEILEVLKYNKLGLSSLLQRIKNHEIITGNYLALSSNGSHPSIDTRIFVAGKVDKPEMFIQPSYLKKVSKINTYNAWIGLWSFAHHQAAIELANRNIDNGVGTEHDYIVKAVVKRRLSNTKESNLEVIKLLEKAKNVNVKPFILIDKEEGITFMRLNDKIEAKKSFQAYLSSLIEIRDNNNVKEIINKNQWLEDEIEWTRGMIYKADSL